MLYLNTPLTLRTSNFPPKEVKVAVLCVVCAWHQSLQQRRTYGQSEEDHKIITSCCRQRGKPTSSSLSLSLQDDTPALHKPAEGPKMACQRDALVAAEFNIPKKDVLRKHVLQCNGINVLMY